MLYEILICNFAALFEPVDGFVDLGIDMSVVDQWLQIAVFDNVWWDEFHSKFFIF